MYEILKLNSISKKIYDVLDDSYHVADDIEAPDAVLVRSANMAEFDIKDNLLAVARAGAGVNNIPLPRMTEKPRRQRKRRQRACPLRHAACEP